MKKIIIPILLIVYSAYLFVGCDGSKNFTVNGNFRIIDPTPVKLFYLSEQSSNFIDSVFSDDGTFVLSGNIDYTGVYLLKFFNDQSVYLIIHPGDKITIDIDNTGDIISYYVEHSPDSKRIRELIDRQNLVLRQIDELSRILLENRADSSLRRKTDSAYMALMLQHKQYTQEFIYSNPKSLANILALYQNFGRKSQPLFDRYDDIDIYNFVDSNLVLLYPETDAVKALNREVNEIKQQIEQSRYIEKIMEQGRPFPEFKYPDINGDTINVGLAHGKPILLYFWASWNSYSAEEFLRLNAYAQKDQSERITILTVSLDISEKELEIFLSSNNIILPVVCDYAYWDSDKVGRYAIKRIPSDIICNKQGLIVDIDIFGDELYNRLNELIR